jgi:hypothetical protein
MTIAAIALLFLTFRLPFDAGSNFVDLFVPVGAALAGISGSVTAFRALRSGAGGKATRFATGVVGTLAGLSTVAGALFLLVIFALCGAYWSATSC